MTRRALLSVAVAAALGATAACSSGPPPPNRAAQLQDVEEWRAAVDRLMRDDERSPIPPEKRDVMLPLRYYPTDARYSVPARLILSDDRPVSEMPTSTGTMMRYERVGDLAFTLEGEARTLGAFVPEGTRRISELFVPFGDTTNRTETYAAGRYLNLQPTTTGMYTVDFNFAYNPYCVYNKSYVCPLPPPSNRMDLPIRAGELLPAE